MAIFPTNNNVDPDAPHVERAQDSSANRSPDGGVALSSDIGLSAANANAAENEGFLARAQRLAGLEQVARDINSRIEDYNAKLPPGKTAIPTIPNFSANDPMANPSDIQAHIDAASQQLTPAETAKNEVEAQKFNQEMWSGVNTALTIGGMGAFSSMGQGLDPIKNMMSDQGVTGGQHFDPVQLFTPEVANGLNAAARGQVREQVQDAGMTRALPR